MSIKNWFFNYLGKKKIGILKVMTDVLREAERERDLPYPKPHHSS